MEDFKELPDLTTKDVKCILRFFANGENQTEAYKYAFDCSKSTDKTIWENSSKFFHSTKVIPWLEYYRKNRQEAIKEEFRYTQAEAFREINDLQKRCSESSKTYNVESKCIENKCRLAGLFNDKPETNVNIGAVEIPSIKVNGQNIKFNVGEIENDD